MPRRHCCLLYRHIHGGVFHGIKVALDGVYPDEYQESSEILFSGVLPGREGLLLDCLAELDPAPQDFIAKLLYTGFGLC